MSAAAVRLEAMVLRLRSYSSPGIATMTRAGSNVPTSLPTTTIVDSGPHRFIGGCATSAQPSRRAFVHVAPGKHGGVDAAPVRTF
jgi:hypothetical protein